MFFSLLKDFMVNIIDAVGYPGVFVAMVIESCLIPLPSEITMPLAGALAAEGRMNIHVASLIGGLGNVVGSLMAYGIGVKIPENTILKFIRRWGKWLFLSEHEYEKTKGWLKKYGSFVSFFSRLLPGIRTVVSLPAGVARIALVPFVVWTFIGAMLWSYVLVYVGYVLGENWDLVEGFFHKFELVIIGVILIAGTWWVWKRVRDKK